MAQETASKTPQSTRRSSAASTSRSPGSSIGADDGGRGATTIADSVVTKVAGIAAREVAGVYALGGTGARAIGSVTQRVGIGDARSQGVSVEVQERRATIELTVVVEYGESIPRLAEALREQVIKRVESITGLEVAAVDIGVDDLHFADDDDAGQA